jgi:hypothetical protein
MDIDADEQASRIKILGRGLDTVILNIYPVDDVGDIVHQRLPDELEEELNSYKERAQQEDEAIPTRWVFAGETLFMKDKGGSHFKWILTCDQFSLAISRGIKVAMLGQVRFSSEYLWRWNHHPEKGISDVLLFLTDIFGPNIAFQPSEVDIAVDITGWDIGSCQIKDRFIHRAVQTAPCPQTVDTTMIAGPEQVIERWKRITGLPFGVHTSAVSCLIYDKQHEIKYHSPKKAWFHDLWLAQKSAGGSAAWDGEAAVWRIEFRFRRQALHEFDLENIYDVLTHIADLWAYAAGHVDGGDDGLPDGWLRYVEPSEDSNRSRWSVHPCWRVIQGALPPSAASAPVPASVSEPETPGRTGAAVPLSQPAPTALDLKPFMRRCKYRVSMMQAFAAIAGYTISVEAWREGYADERQLEEQVVEPDISDTFHFIFENVQAYLDDKKRDFTKLVRKKRVLYRLQAIA